MFGRHRIIDLSVPLAHQAASEPMPADIHYVTHEAEGLAQMERYFGVRPEDLVYSEGLGWAVEEIRAITHTGTHVDAPYHYAPVSEGKPARTIDQVPLEWCFAPGVVLDMRHKPADALITVEDLQQALAQHRVRAACSAISCCCKPAPTSGSVRPTILRSRVWDARGRCGWSSRGSK